jgi:hypothetical protein
MKSLGLIPRTICLLGLAAIGLVLTLPGGPGSSAAVTDASFCRPNRTTPVPDAGTGHHPGFEARMTVGPGTPLAGEQPSIRIVNSGRDLLEWGNQRVDRSVGGSWIPMRLPGGSAEPAFSILVLPESVTGCTGPETGRGWPSGTYRWTLNVNAVARSGPDGRHKLRAIFRLRAT